MRPAKLIGCMTLYSYTVRVDDGAAPNPFRGLCTLAICKPGIRRTARKGDWIAGLGSKNPQGGTDLSGKLVYAMQVREVVSMADYDRLAPSRWPHRLPSVTSADLSERLGDCIYDFSGATPVQRLGVHGRGNVQTDLSGENVLISDDFYYFGSRAIGLPADLLPICHQTQGHKSSSNAARAKRFVSWIRGLGLRPGQLYGWPDYIVDWDSRASTGCKVRQLDDAQDSACD